MAQRSLPCHSAIQVRRKTVPRVPIRRTKTVLVELSEQHSPTLWPPVPQPEGEAPSGSITNDRIPATTGPVCQGKLSSRLQIEPPLCSSMVASHA